MRDQYHRQVRELMSNYGKIDILWFDGGEQNWLGFGGQWVFRRPVAEAAPW